MAPKQKPLHYQLITGEIFFRHKSEEATMSTRINGVISDPNSTKIPVRLLGKAQQILQMQFFQMMGDDAKDVNVLNCVIYGFTYLGYMTEEEFQAPPEGTVLQEIKLGNEANSAVQENPKVVEMPQIKVSLEQAVAEAEKTK